MKHNKYSSIIHNQRDLHLFHLQKNNETKIKFSDIGLLKKLVNFNVVKSYKREEFYSNEDHVSLNKEVDLLRVENRIKHLVNLVSNSMENLRWAGDTTNVKLNCHDGVIKQIQDLNPFNATTNPTGYQAVTNTPVTTSNVIDEIKKVIYTLPLGVRKDTGFKVIVSPNISSTLIQVVMASSNNNIFTFNSHNSNGLAFKFYDYPIYIVNGLNASNATNNIILAGIFEDSKRGVLKASINKLNTEEIVKTVELKNGFIRFYIKTDQAVGINPDGSQIAMNA